jgi:predicted nuclease of predicted toxin-antitoxin system
MNEALKFIADEGFDKEIVLALREEYDVIYIAESGPGADDEVILKQAETAQRIVLTLDKDFGELVFRRGKAHSGVILCRLQGLSAEEKRDLVKATVFKYGHDLINSFTVIQPKNLRIRKF